MADKIELMSIPLLDVSDAPLSRESSAEVELMLLPAFRIERVHALSLEPVDEPATITKMKQR
jgi:hypothetical protein